MTTAAAQRLVAAAAVGPVLLVSARALDVKEQLVLARRRPDAAQVAEGSPTWLQRTAQPVSPVVQPVESEEPRDVRRARGRRASTLKSAMLTKRPVQTAQVVAEETRQDARAVALAARPRVAER
jgi:hypothetical protein